MGKLNLDNVNKLGSTAGAIVGGVQMVKSLFENRGKEEKRQDARQIEMQGKLNEINSKTNKELADYEQALKMKMWQDTNYGAQLEQAGKAGLSKVAVLGGSGGGTQGATVTASGIGNGAASGAQNDMVKTQAELAKAQTANLMANTGKTIAETKKIGGVDTTKTSEEARGSKFVNDINDLNKDEISRAKGWNASKEIMSGEQANYEWEALKTVIKGSVEDPENPLVKAKAAELMTKVQTLDNLIKDNENKIKDGTLKDDEHKINEINMKINDFKATLTEIGINGETAGMINGALKLLFGIIGKRIPQKK